jgi:hypothetical protein
MEHMNSNSWTTLFAGLQVLVTCGLGVPTLVYLKRYVDETAKLAKQAESQREGQVSPALVLDNVGDANAAMVSIRNIGEHAAFDVQVQPVPAQKPSNKKYIFERIPVIEKGKGQSVKLIQESKSQLEVLTTRAYDEIMRSSLLTVTCKSMNNRLHIFRFQKGRSVSNDADYFYLIEHL